MERVIPPLMLAELGLYASRGLTCTLLKNDSNQFDGELGSSRMHPTYLTIGIVSRICVLCQQLVEKMSTTLVIHATFNWNIYMLLVRSRD